MRAFLKHPVARVGLLLAAFAITATALVAMTEQNTREQIKQNEQETLLSTIGELVAKERYDNAILQDTLLLPPTPELQTTQPTTVYRARQDGKPVAAVITAVAPDGYSGSIRLLLGINYDGSLSGVRVISHKETPGLGDKIEAKRNDWILQFSGLSLDNPDKNQWKVKKDGGQFDQFTGATITPRAVVEAIKSTLIYFAAHRDQLFAETEHN